MADDFDPFDDLLGVEPAKNARAVGKFRPKPKPQPQRKATVKSLVTSTKVTQTVHSAPQALSESIETGKSLECCSDVVPNHNDKADVHALVGTSVEENDDVLIGLEAIADGLPHTNTECKDPRSDAAVLFASNTENVGGSIGTQVSSSIDVATSMCKTDVHDDPCPSADVVVLNTDVDIAKDNRQGTEEMDVMDSMDMAELTTKSGQKTNFQQPKLKTCEASGSTSYSVGLQSSPIQPYSSEKDLSPTSQHDDVVDLSSLDFTNTLPTESTSELRLSEESMNLLGVPRLDPCTHMEDLPEIPAKLASRRARTGFNKNNAISDPHPEHQKASTSSKENEAGRSLRPRNGKKNVCGLVDDDVELIATGEFSVEHPFNSAIDEENMNSEQPVELQKKTSKRKLKKTQNNKEKPPRKTKKAKDVPEQETHVKQKKFSHSTRRRRVDKNLLNIPEEEFDPREVSLRDLILLAEHRERQMKSDHTAAATLETLKSAGNSAGLHNDEAYNYGADEDDDDGIPIAEDTTEYFNYHSRMDRTPRVRWSKQDTELFYEAVKQFGTDFSMIAQLFPGRSREQIRNKYKKEERQKPLMLREALTTRCKDHSYFEKVIDDLKQLRAKDEKEDLEDLSNQEGTSNHDDDETKHDFVEEEGNGDIANDFTEAQSSHVKGEKEEEVEVEEDEDAEPWNNLNWD